MTDLQKTAVATAGGTDQLGTLRTLSGLCAQTSPYYTAQILNDRQIHEAKGMLQLCPDNPKAAEVQSRVDLLDAKAVASQSQDEAVKNGTYAADGKHLVGAGIKPGTWQSVGTKVEDCYWEVSDANGDIIDNNFISIAPQFTITIPGSAAGFTNTGCAFQRIGD